MATFKFTIDRIAQLTCAPGKSASYHYDTEAPGLGLRVTATGSKSYIFQGYVHDTQFRLTIGDTSAWRLDAPAKSQENSARKEARRLQTLCDAGIDPRQEKADKKSVAEQRKAAQVAAQQEHERRQRYTLRALCCAYADALERAGKDKSAAATRSSFKCHVFEAHPEIANTAACDITSHQVAAMIRKVRETGKERAAGILRSYLSAAFNAAKRAPFDSALPVDLIAFGVEHNPVDNIPAIPVQAGNRTLSTEELCTYMAALTDDLPDQALRLALLAGGQRMAQLLRARVSDYDPETQTLRLWDGKGKRTSMREHLLPLAPKAAALMAGLVERAKSMTNENAEAGARWLFSTYGRVKMTETTPGKRVAEIADCMKVEPFDLRDIRRTVETMLASMGVSRDIRAQLLSHGISGVQAAHYDRHSYTSEKRAALIAWEARLEQIGQDAKYLTI